jgi:hypothetical protein
LVEIDTQGRYTICMMATALLQKSFGISIAKASVEVAVRTAFQIFDEAVRQEKLREEQA